MLKKLCLAALFALPAAAMADGLSYGYIEGSYVVPEEDSAFRLAGSFAINPQLFVKVEGTSYDGGELYSGELGFRHALNDTLDLNITGGGLYADSDGSGSESGFTFGGGLRALVMPKLELNGGIQYLDIADSSEVGFSAGAVYSLMPQFALIGGGRFIDSSEEFNVGVRYSF